MLCCLDDLQIIQLLLTDERNLALDRPSKQSSVCGKPYLCERHPGDPSLAVDGSRNPLGLLTACTSTHLQTEGDLWWSVRLMNYTKVTEVIITQFYGMFHSLTFNGKLKTDNISD